MSWSISRGGKKDEIAKLVTEDFDREAARYDGTPEGGDVKAAKDRVLALVEAISDTPDDVTPRPGVSVSAWGSHSTSDGKVLSAQMTINVSRINLPEPVAEPAAS